MSSWLEEGYMVHNNLLDRVRVEMLREACVAIREQWLRRDPLTGAGSETPLSETCMRHINHPAYFAEDRKSLIDLLELFVDERIMDTLEEMWDEAAVFRSTSLFFNPTDRGVDGSWHRDTQFLFPSESDEKAAIKIAQRTGGEGVQVQIPLVEDNSLEYVCGSHDRWDIEREWYIRRSEQGKNSHLPIPEATRASMHPGDVVFFDPNGIHRGTYYAHIPRLTIMVTYTRPSFRARADRFSYQPWFNEPGYLDGISSKARKHYQRFLNHYSVEWSEHPVPPERFHSGRRS